MTFIEKESSRAQGQPITLYSFGWGSRRCGYTDAEQSLIHGGITYQPVAIKRSSTGSGAMDKAKLTVSMEASTEVARLFLIYPPTQIISLVVRSGHVGETDFPVIWSGRVIQCERNRIQADLSCEAISSSMRRSGLRRNYQLSCPHVLYGEQCRASKKKVTKEVKIMQVHFTRLVFPSGWSGHIRPEKYTGGMVAWDTPTGTETRTILGNTDAKTLTLAGPTTGLKAGETVRVMPGCNRQMGYGPQPHGDCGPLHDNIRNFGGQAWIPGKNPIKINPFN